MSSIETNPAARLYAVLKENIGKGDGPPAAEIWAESFGVDRSDHATLLQIQADLFALTKDAEEKILEYGLSQELYLNPLRQVQRALGGLGLEQQWKFYKQILTKQIVRDIGHLGFVLAQTASAEQEVDHEQLEALLNDVDALLRDVLNAELPAILTRLIVKSLEAIRYGLITFRINGADGLEEELASVAWFMHIYKKTRPKEEEDSEAIRSYKERFWDIVIRAGQLLAIVRSIPAIEHIVKELKPLLSLPPPP